MVHLRDHEGRIPPDYWIAVDACTLACDVPRFLVAEGILPGRGDHEGGPVCGLICRGRWLALCLPLLAGGVVDGDEIRIMLRSGWE